MTCARGGGRSDPVMPATPTSFVVTAEWAELRGRVLAALDRCEVFLAAMGRALQGALNIYVATPPLGGTPAP